MIDLHCHSSFSDGSDEPSELLYKGIEKGLRAIALTDHDNINGLADFINNSTSVNIMAINGIEIDAKCMSKDCNCDVHLLGYGFDINSPEIKKLLDRQIIRRNTRNEKLIEKLRSLGIPIETKAPEEGKIISLTHIADEIVKLGFALNISDAFAKYLGNGAAARTVVEKIGAAEFIEAVHSSKGLCFLAHPTKIEGGYEELLYELFGYSIDGIEAYYPSHTLSEVKKLRNLAIKNNIMISCGSDFHGSFRPDIELGEVSKIASRDPLIIKTLEYFLARN